MDFDFCETLDTISLIFYVSPKLKNEPAIELVNPTTLKYNEALIELYKPVHSLVIEKTKSKFLAILQKETKCKWGSYNGHKFVPKINDLVYKNDEIEEQNDGSKSLWDTLSHIYDNGTDDVRRAMNKSLNESNGTVLSTDWSDVANKNIKPEN